MPTGILAMILEILRVIGYAAAIFFIAVTVTMMADGEIAATIFSIICTAVPIVLIWLTSKKLINIRDAKEKELQWLTPELYTLITIVEREGNIDTGIEETTDRLTEMENVGSVYEFSIDEVRQHVPNFYVDKYPTYLIVNDSPNEDIAEMLNNIRVKGLNAEPLLRFLEQEMRKHEQKLRIGREGNP